MTTLRSPRVSGDSWSRQAAHAGRSRGSFRPFLGLARQRALVPELFPIHQRLTPSRWPTDWPTAHRSLASTLRAPEFRARIPRLHVRNQPPLLHSPATEHARAQRGRLVSLAPLGHLIPR